MPTKKEKRIPNKKAKQIPTKKQKEAELRKVTKISGFRHGVHDFIAEVNLKGLKKRNDSWDEEHEAPLGGDRRTEELIRLAAYVAMRNTVPHIQIHIHAAHQAGVSAEELYRIIERLGRWCGGDARQFGYEAWRLVFRPDLPTVFRVVALTNDSFKK